MIKEFVFTIGLPGCGKSTYLGGKYKNVFDYQDWNTYFIHNQTNDPKFGLYCQQLINEANTDGLVPVVMIAADELKPFLPGYTHEHPEVVHEDSVQLARKLVYELATDETFNSVVVMDGGAINNHYTEDIIKYIRENSPVCNITAVFFDTPVEVCIDRVSKRERKVPVKVIYDKNQQLVKCVNKYKTMVDDFIRVDYFTNKYIMLDMDGTICAYTKAKCDEYGNADFVNGELFRYLRPVQHVIDFIREHYNMKNVYICTACPNIIAWNEKNAWLDEHFPEIPVENRLFCGNKDWKYVFVKQFAMGKKWKLNDVTLIDDYSPTINKCTEIGINCIHPSNIDALTDKYAIFA